MISEHPQLLAMCTCRDKGLVKTKRTGNFEHVNSTKLRELYFGFHGIGKFLLFNYKRRNENPERQRDLHCRGTCVVDDGKVYRQHISHTLSVHGKR